MTRNYGMNASDYYWSDKAGYANTTMVTHPSSTPKALLGKKELA